MERVTLAQGWGWGCPGQGALGTGCCWTVTGGQEDTGVQGKGMAHHHLLPSGPSFPFQLLGSRAPLLDITCFEHSPRPLVFSPAQSQFQFTVALSTHLAGIPGLLPQAGLSGPRRSLVTRWGTKSLFAKHSVSGAHFPLALP